MRINRWPAYGARTIVQHMKPGQWYKAAELPVKRHSIDAALRNGWIIHTAEGYALSQSAYEFKRRQVRRKTA